MLTNDIISFEQLDPDLRLPYSTPYMSFKIAQMTHMNDDMNPFALEFLNWTLPSLNMDMSIVAYGDMSHLIWIYTVCKGIRYGLRAERDKAKFMDASN